MKKVAKTAVILFLIIPIVAFLLFAGIILAVIISEFANSDTNLFGESYPHIDNGYVLENDRYAIIQNYDLSDTLILDKQNLTVKKLKTTDDIYRYSYTHNVELSNDNIKISAFLEVWEYDKNTGKIDKTDYYLVDLVFDMQGNEISKVKNDKAYSYDEFIGFLLESDTVKDFTISVANGVYDEDFDKTSLSSDELIIYDYVEGIEKELKGDYHSTDIVAKYINDKIYFSVILCNEKGWKGQNPTIDGIYKSYIVCYDIKTKEFNILFDSDKEEFIVTFNDERVVTKKGNKLKSYDYKTSKSKKIFSFDKDEYQYITVAGNYIIIKTYDFSDDNYVFITFDGTVICECKCK